MWFSEIVLNGLSFLLMLALLEPYFLTNSLIWYDAMNWRHNLRFPQNSQETFLLIFFSHSVNFKSLGWIFKILWQLVWFGLLEFARFHWVLLTKMPLFFYALFWHESFREDAKLEKEKSGKIMDPCQFFTRLKRPERGAQSVWPINDYVGQGENLSFEFSNTRIGLKKKTLNKNLISEDFLLFITPSP